MALYDRKKDVFRNYSFGGYSAVRALCADHAGNLMIGGYSGLIKFNHKTGTALTYFSQPGKRNRLLSNTILSIFEDGQHRLWIGTNAGLNLLNEHTNEFVTFQHAGDDPNSIADNIIRSIAGDIYGNLWFGTNNGLSKLRPDGKTFENYIHKGSPTVSTGWNCIYSIKSDKSGDLWVGTDEGVHIFNYKSNTSQLVSPDKRNKYSLKGTTVRCIFIDDAGIYWVGSYQGGVCRYDKNLALFSIRESNPLDPSGLRSSVVTSFVEDPSGNVYVGTDRGGLNLYHRNTGLFSHPKIAPGDNKLIILAMELVNDELWIGTFRQGIYVLNIKNGHVKHFDRNEPNGLSNNEVFSLKKDSKGNVWIGTNGGGVNLYNAKTGRIEKLESMTGAQDGDFSKYLYVRDIVEDRAGNIWIAAIGLGVGIYNPVQKSFRILNSDNNSVSSVHVDHNGNIWLGTLGGGLYLFDGRSDRFTCFSEQAGLSNAVIYKILEDNSGNLWVSTNNGISSFDPETKRFKNYSYQNGIQRSTFIPGSGLKTKNGEMFFGGFEGFNYFKPLALRNNRNVPSLQFTSLKISNRVILPGEKEAISEHISIAKEIRLNYKQNFSLDFIALSYTTPDDSRYSYKLDGFDKDWNLAGKSHTAVYTNLDPGEYTFHVRATSEDGAWTTPEKTIKIFVKPPFWRTTYAYLFYVVLAFSILALLRYQGVRKIKNRFILEQERLQIKQMIEQERKEAERRHEFDQLRIKFLTNLGHEFRTPISLVAGPVDKLISLEDSLEKKSHLSLAKRNINRLLNLVNQLLDFKRLEQNELMLDLSKGDIVLFVRDIADSFKDISEARQIDFRFSSSLERYPTLFDRNKMERVLFNLLSNAFKFTPKGGKVELRIEKAVDGNLKILVRDNGIGMSKEVQDKIFDRFFQANSDNGLLNQGNGIGLSIAKEFVRLHGGMIAVESTAGKGSLFSLKLPFERVTESSDEFEPVESVINGYGPVPDKNSAKGNTPKVTVLLIEDDDDFRQYLKDNLKSYYKIVEASNGKEGWQRVLSTHPHVVVSDINMPYMDGITLSRKIKSDKRTSHIPVILLTALTGESYHLNGLQTGASDFITKPFNFEILNVKINNLAALNQKFKDTYSRQLQVSTSEIDVQPSEYENLLATITKYVESNIENSDLSVEDLSKQVFMSRGSLYNKIVDLTGESPGEFIRSIRLKKAVGLLEKSNMKIADIGYAVGFSSPTYFARAFKAKYQVSPSEYASMMRNPGDSDPT
ncbi:MAG: two-component regulator propeller domain-containing protein [Chitinophagaceae bacterium]|nr:two-component regulator propeller domain-containing protein [Chitinophagaceae bacterium]